MNLKDYIADIPDFPSKGILFRDVTPLLADGKAYKEAISLLVQRKDLSSEMMSDVMEEIMTNQATDGTKGYKTDCGCFFVIKKDEPVEDTDVCDCGKRIMLHD